MNELLKAFAATLPTLAAAGMTAATHELLGSPDFDFREALRGPFPAARFAGEATASVAVTLRGGTWDVIVADNKASVLLSVPTDLSAERPLPAELLLHLLARNAGTRYGKWVAMPDRGGFNVLVMACLPTRGLTGEAIRECAEALAFETAQLYGKLGRD